MANYMNIFAGPIAFIGASILAYGFWDPVMTFIEAFPLELYAMAGTTFIAILFWAIVVLPFNLMTADDSGN